MAAAAGWRSEATGRSSRSIRARASTWRSRARRRTACPRAAGIATERIPLTAAVDAYTSGAAWASFDEQRKGTLARDLLADIVILSADIFAPDARVMDAVVDTTIFDGKVVYTRPTPAATE